MKNKVDEMKKNPTKETKTKEAKPKAAEPKDTIQKIAKKIRIIQNEKKLKTWRCQIENG
jgi:hypothetical protein